MRSRSAGRAIATTLGSAGPGGGPAGAAGSQLAYEAGGAAAPSRLRRLVPSVRAVRGLTSIVALLALWQICASLEVVNPVFVSSPVDVVKAADDYLLSAQFGSDIKITAVTFVVGLAASIVVGLVVGFAIGWSKTIGDFIEPLVTLAYAVPRIALVPLFVIWFGIGTSSAIVMTATMAIFPVILNVAAGVRAVDRDLIDLARSFGADTRRILTTVVFPASIPYALAGIRLAVGMALIGTIVAEFVLSAGGIGYTMSNAANNFETGLVFVGVVVVSILGLLFSGVVRAVEKRVQGWRAEP